MRLRSKSIILIMLLPVFLKAQLIPISSARLQPLGSTVTVRGKQDIRFIGCPQLCDRIGKFILQQSDTVV